LPHRVSCFIQRAGSFGLFPSGFPGHLIDLRFQIRYVLRHLIFALHETLQLLATARGVVRQPGNISLDGLLLTGQIIGPALGVLDVALQTS
jgi:hypothetical protein